MKKIALLLLLACGFAHADAFSPNPTTRMGLSIPIVSTSNFSYPTTIAADFQILDSSVALLSTTNTFTSTNTFTQDIVLSYGSASQCLALDSNKNVISQQCGGGGSTPALAVGLGTASTFVTSISSPTSVLKFSNTSFKGQLTGSATAFVDLNGGATYFIQNQSAGVQSATAWLSSATVTNINGSLTDFTTGIFRQAVVIGTSTQNGQTFRIIDNGFGLATYENQSNATTSLSVMNDSLALSPAITLVQVGSGGDSYTGAVAGDSILQGSNNLYVRGGGPTSSVYVRFMSTGVVVSTLTANAIKFGDGSIQTTASSVGSFINNTGTYQTDALYNVSSGTILNRLTVDNIAIPLGTSPSINFTRTQTQGNNFSDQDIDWTGSYFFGSDHTQTTARIRYDGVGTNGGSGAPYGDLTLSASGVQGPTLFPLLRLSASTSISPNTAHNIYIGGPTLQNSAPVPVALNFATSVGTPTITYDMTKLSISTAVAVNGNLTAGSTATDLSVPLVVQSSATSMAMSILSLNPAVTDSSLYFQKATPAPIFGILNYAMGGITVQPGDATFFTNDPTGNTVINIDLSTSTNMVQFRNALSASNIRHVFNTSGNDGEYDWENTNNRFNFLSTLAIRGNIPIISTSTLQSGTTFYVSSGTVSGSLTSGSLSVGGAATFGNAITITDSRSTDAKASLTIANTNSNGASDSYGINVSAIQGGSSEGEYGVYASATGGTSGDAPSYGIYGISTSQGNNSGGAVPTNGSGVFGEMTAEDTNLVGVKGHAGLSQHFGPGSNTGYAGYFYSNGSGSNSTNYGLYTTATNATLNYGLWVNAGQSVLNDGAAIVEPNAGTRYVATFSTSTAAPYTLSVSTINHINSVSTSSPTLTSCGTGPSVVGNDFAFTITGGAAATGCTATFTKAYTNTPVCLVSQETMSVVNALSYTVSATAITITQTGLGTNKLDVICVGRD